MSSPGNFTLFSSPHRSFIRRVRGWLLIAFILLSSVIAARFILPYISKLIKERRATVVGWQAMVTTFAGSGAPGLRDAAAREARFADPFGVVVDQNGNVYVADAGENNCIRKIAPDGTVSTFVGGAREGFTDGQGQNASFNTPSALAIDARGNLYVADTGNNAIRKVTPEAMVSTLAGDGTAGYRDGTTREAQFNAPVGLAVDASGNVYVADTYNDLIREITPDGMVKTLAGGATPGAQDGAINDARFDTPCGIVVTASGELFIADTGNGRIRKLTRDGQATTLPIKFINSMFDSTSNAENFLREPTGLALTHDNFLYVTERKSGRVIQIAPDGVARVIAGAGASGFDDGIGGRARFNEPSGVALDETGALYVADEANYLVRKLAPVQETTREANAANDAKPEPLASPNRSLPELNAAVLHIDKLLWPVDPQDERHELVATLGEVRGNYEGESRDHLHSGIDIQGSYGAPVRVIYEEKVRAPVSNWGFNTLGEGVEISAMTYIHLRVGRSEKDQPLADARFIIVRDAEGKPARVHIRRGTRFHIGDELGTINRMYHVHLNVGPWGAQINPLSLPFIGFSDSIAPKIESIQLYTTDGAHLTERHRGRLVVPRQSDVSIIVDAYDQVDGNAARRRLGLYRLGYQILRADGTTPAPGFENPRVNIEFNRLPSDADAVRLAYSETSGITIYGSAATKFLYVVTNVVRDGRVASDAWHPKELLPGDYVLRIFAADFNGNEALIGRDTSITIE